MGLTAYERETVINMNDDDDLAYVSTHQRTVITALKKNPAAVLESEGIFDGTRWANFHIPCELVSFRTRVSRPNLSPEQRAEAGRRLRAGRVRAETKRA
jgi:hypothetical protein